jgi:hypothetical protein
VVSLDDHGGIDRPYGSAGEFDLRLTHVCERVHGLTVKIAGVESIGVNEAETTDTRAREVLNDGAAESAGADDEYARRGELGLAGGADLFE